MATPWTPEHQSAVCDLGLFRSPPHPSATRTPSTGASVCPTAGLLTLVHPARHHPIVGWRDSAPFAASLAAAGIASLTLVDTHTGRVQGLASRLRDHAPRLPVTIGSSSPAAFDIIVNATPLGMSDDDPLPFDPASLAVGSLVGEVVLAEGMTPLLRSAAACGCKVQTGLDMLFEMIPAYLEFFGLPTTTADELRSGARL